MQIDKVALLGAGVMGGGIAAHLANCGFDVLLLDRVPDGATGKERSVLATRALEALGKSKAGFFTPAQARRIEPGNLEDDLHRLGECDWVIEVVVEDLAVKHALLGRVAPRLRKDAVLSSNTSGLAAQAIAACLPADLQRRFLVTHFFNPPRVMRLVEVVATEATAPEVVRDVSELIRRRLGKVVVKANDTPNFIANRIGVFSMCNGVRHLEDLGLSIEEADAVAGAPTARPATGLFRLADLVGLDTILHVARNSYDNLPRDEARETFRATGLFEALVSRGLLGDKSGAGFYRKSKDKGSGPLVWDRERQEHVPATAAAPAWAEASRRLDAAGRLRATLAAGDRAAEFAWRNLRDTLLYAFLRIPEVADDVVAIDDAMRWGFGWELGPLEMLDAIGVSHFVARAERDGVKVPPELRRVDRFYQDDERGRRALHLGSRELRPVPAPPDRIELGLLKRRGGVVEENAAASIVDLGDGVLALEFHTKMNAIDGPVLEMLHRALRLAEARGGAVVVANEGRAFSAGANLGWVLSVAADRDFATLGGYIDQFQRASLALRYARVPVVAAPHGLALGGACELCLHADAIVAHAETTMGLVEVGVGLVPGGGGTKELALRAIQAAGEVGADVSPFVAKTFDLIASGRRGSSGDELRDLGLLRGGDEIVIDPDARLRAAKQKALSLAACYRPPLPPGELNAPGRSVAAALESNLYNLRIGGFISDHDARIGAAVARILTGGDVPGGAPVSEARLLELEREAFLSLCGEERTLARIRHMLETGKPLRN